MHYLAQFWSWSMRRRLVVGITVLIVSFTLLNIITADPSASRNTATEPAQTTTGAAMINVSALLPEFETRNIFETEQLPYASKQVNDGSLAKGTQTVRTAGAEGRRVVTYEALYLNGSEVKRTLVSDLVTLAPTDEVIAIGTGTTRTCEFGSFTIPGGDVICIKRDKKNWRDWIKWES